MGMTIDEAVTVFKDSMGKYELSELDCAKNLAIDTMRKYQKMQGVLGKIRAEIESQREEVSKKHSENEGLTNYYFGLNDGLKDARDILDKYKVESEDKE